jgi:hypothetical protein
VDEGVVAAVEEEEEEPEADGRLLAATLRLVVRLCHTMMREWAAYIATQAATGPNKAVVSGLMRMLTCVV